MKGTARLPLSHLLTNLINSIERVAPEKAASLRRQVEEEHISFAIDGVSREMVFFATPSTSTITFGLHSLEFLWARAFAYSSLYDFLTSMLVRGEDISDVDLSQPAIKPAMDLLSWAISTEFQIRNGSNANSEWPVNLPRPSPDADRTTFENAADELMLVAVAAILHHEIGHIVRDHDPRTLDLDENGNPTAESRETLRRWENEADAWAAEWLLDGLDIDDDRFLKRVLGLSLVYLWIASRNVYTGEWLPSYHPPAWDRIYHNVKNYIPDTPLHPVWTFIGYVIQLHLMSTNTHPEIAEAETPEDWVNKLLDYVSRLQTEQSRERE